MDNITYDVRIWKTKIYKGGRSPPTKSGGRPDPRPWKQPFRTKAQAASFEAELRSAARRGEAFDITTGRPSHGAGKTTTCPGTTSASPTWT